MNLNKSNYQNQILSVPVKSGLLTIKVPTDGYLQIVKAAEYAKGDFYVCEWVEESTDSRNASKITLGKYYLPKDDTPKTKFEVTWDVEGQGSFDPIQVIQEVENRTKSLSSLSGFKQ